METDKPKTWHGPRGFFREYLIIVVGVLTALGGQQAVDWIHQQGELAETREALREELAKDSSIIVTGAAVDRCRSELYAKYADWARGGNRPEKVQLVGVPFPSFSAWDVAKAGPLSRMPVNERLTYSQVYERLEGQRTNDTNQLSVGLEMAQYFDLEQLAPDQAQRVLELNNAARTQVTGKGRTSADILNDLQALGISPAPASESRREAVNDFCKALGLPTPL